MGRARALTLCVLGMFAWPAALTAVGKGLYVYLFLTGMMVASELARKEGLLDYLAALAAKRAAGSAKKPFFLMYCADTVVRHIRTRSNARCGGAAGHVNNVRARGACHDEPAPRGRRNRDSLRRS